MTIARVPNTLVILGVWGTILVLLIWSVWTFWRPKSKTATNPIKKVLGLLGMLFLVVLLWIAWKFQPWMPAGHAVHLTSNHIGDYDFQVWQRKNAVITEPFSTGLFARKQGGQWKAFLLDIQDVYHPTITLRKEESGIAVLYGGTVRGYFDDAQQVFKRNSRSGVSLLIDADVIDSEPPGNWWLRESATQ